MVVFLWRKANRLFLLATALKQKNSTKGYSLRNKAKYSSREAEKSHRLFQVSRANCDFSHPNK
jgi:hypothetical protein